MAKHQFLSKIKKNKQFIACVFVKKGTSTIVHGALPDADVYTPETVVDGVRKLIEGGIDSILLFGIGSKDSLEEAYEKGNVVEQSIINLRSTFGDSVTIFADIGLSPYNKDGHSVLFVNGEVLVKESLELAGKMALSYAKAGADFIAPCLSVDGQVAYLRNTLDTGSHDAVGIMAYSAKFASSFYGPYRKTIESPLMFGGKEAYQLPVHDLSGALETIKADDREGADILMVKPALAYGDIISKAKLSTTKPISVYNVSGEYCMVKAAAQAGYVDEGTAFNEIFTSFFRAGADIIITYAVKYIIKTNTL